MQTTHIHTAPSLADDADDFALMSNYFVQLCTSDESKKNFFDNCDAFPFRCNKMSMVTNRSYVFSDINNKGSPIDYKSGNSGGSACSTPTKDTLKQYDRAYSGPMMPARGMGGLFGGSATGTLGTAHHMSAGPPPHHHHHHYSTPLNFRKGFSSRCTWKCTAILVIMLCVVLMSILVYMSGEFQRVDCTSREIFLNC